MTTFEVVCPGKTRSRNGHIICVVSCHCNLSFRNYRQRTFFTQFGILPLTFNLYFLESEVASYQIQRESTQPNGRNFYTNLSIKIYISFRHRDLWPQFNGDHYFSGTRQPYHLPFGCSLLEVQWKRFQNLTFELWCLLPVLSLARGLLPRVPFHTVWRRWAETKLETHTHTDRFWTPP